ncbi:MAG: hypothetical protein ACRD3E_06485, partial [Terriglobales bacterium]
TWKLNEAKSKVPAGAGKNPTVVYTAEGDKVKCVVDGVDGSGNPVHNEWVGKFDGKDYPLVGDPTADSRSYKMADARHYMLWNKKGGKTVMSGMIVYSANGKSRTVTSHSTDAKGKKITIVQVYDKQ